MSIGDIWEEIKTAGQSAAFTGVMPAVVTSIDDPDNLARVKVRLLNRSSSDYETDFIRVMTPMSGKKWGCFFFPEVGDEVLVAFSSGDIARPYVLGALWNQQYQPPAAITDQQNLDRLIKSKSGHEIRLHDEEGKEKIEIRTPGALQIKLDDESQSITLLGDSNKISIKVKDGAVAIEGAKKLSLCAGDAKLTLSGETNAATLESGQSIKIKSQQIKIEAQSMLTVKSGGNLTVSCDGPASLKGAVVKLN